MANSAANLFSISSPTLPIYCPSRSLWNNLCSCFISI